MEERKSSAVLFVGSVAGIAGAEKLSSEPTMLIFIKCATS
jgi:hypothetical protein